MRLEEIHMRPEEMLDYVKECCASNWNRPASMVITEFSIDYIYNKAGGVRVDAVYRGCYGYIIIPFTDIENIGESVVFDALLSLKRELLVKESNTLIQNFTKAIRGMRKVPKIKRVIFNDPATIVFWGDNTKTIVKAENETFDAEKGLAMAIAKKALGNEGNYYNELKKHLGDAYETEI